VVLPERHLFHPPGAESGGYRHVSARRPQGGWLIRAGVRTRLCATGQGLFPGPVEVSFLPLDRTSGPLIVIVEDALIDTLNTPDFRRSRRELPVCQYQLLP
jgi:hypothetical protein